MKIDIDNYVDEMEEDEYEEANDGTKRLFVDLSRLADDQMNKVLKTIIVLVYVYGFFVAITDIWENL